jgi:hypothetical protein
MVWSVSLAGAFFSGGGKNGGSFCNYGSFGVPAFSWSVLIAGMCALFDGRAGIAGSIDGVFVAGSRNHSDLREMPDAGSG